MRRLTYEPTRDAETHSAFTRRRGLQRDGRGAHPEPARGTRAPLTGTFVIRHHLRIRACPTPAVSHARPWDAPGTRARYDVGARGGTICVGR